MEKNRSAIIHCTAHDCANNAEGNCSLKEIRIDPLGDCLNYKDMDNDD